MKRNFVITLVGCLLLVSAIGAAAQAKAGAGKISDGAVKIGVITDLSGLYSTLAVRVRSSRHRWP